MFLNKKFAVVILLASMCMMLSGCCLRHEWQEATCSAPKTCSECGKIEGEALPHTWVAATCLVPKTCSVCQVTEGDVAEHTWIEATCTEPKTCSLCDKTEGEPLPHNLVEANYQAPATCVDCGVTEGNPLQADFEKYGLVTVTDPEAEYKYHTVCYEAPELATVGTATYSYEKITGDDTHPALEGYEWILARIEVVFGDENSWYYGISAASCSEDYYDIKLHDDSTVLSEDETYQLYTVNFNGVDHTQCMHFQTTEWLGWDEKNTQTYVIEHGFRVPVGYDGTVIGLRNAGVAWEDGQYINDVADENTLFFRLQ